MENKISERLVDSMLRLPRERAEELITELSEAYGVVYGQTLRKALSERTHKEAVL